MKKNYFLIMIVLGSYSCQKEISTEVSNTNTSQQLDVYVAGYVSDLSAGIPAYWKNGKLVLIDSAHYNFTPSYGLLGASALSMAVSGNDVYLTGYEIYQSPYTGNHYYAICWKNGMPGNLTGGGATSTEAANSIAVSGKDVYVAGAEDVSTNNYVARYWKNGNRVNLSGGTNNSYANSIAVSGTDVYAAGYEEIGYQWIAKYWKNGNPVNLTDGTKYAQITSIAASGNNVYVAGYEEDNNRNYVAKYWKNGTPVNLTGSTGSEIPTAIAVSGTDVYVAGFDGARPNLPLSSDGGVAKYWKNGSPVNLTDGSKRASATSIAVSGNDVYVAGYEEKTAGSYDYVAKYWKNGTPIILGDISKYSESKAITIFLVQK
jgi:hypothetical protein